MLYLHNSSVLLLYEHLRVRNYLLNEAVNSLPAAAGQELLTARSPIANPASDSRDKTRMGSGLRGVESRSLSRENTSRTVPVLHHVLYRDDFDQTPVSNNIS